MALLQIDRVGKDHGPTRVLGDVSLTVADGELLVLVGPSGCGKSTLLRCVAGLEELSRGAILMDGVDITRAEPRDRDIAMVFQSYALYPHLSVRDNLAFGLKMRKTPKDEIARRIGDAAEMLGLTALLERRPAQLSGGQRQRVAMGRAVVRRPKVFLFDEPLSNLDAALRGQMRVELMRLHQRLSATMVYVTHDQVEAMTLADRIAVLSGGALMQVGTPSELYTQPANLFVAKFIGTPEMNVVDARAAQASRLTGALPKEVASVGVRAEDLRLAAGGVGAQVDVVEHLGAEALVHLRVEMIELVARVEAQPALGLPRTGERVQVAIDPARLHYFDAQGQRLDRPQSTVDSSKLGLATP
ncbi:MAG TPA: sn-glycerol-3-phosphate ABC transporter ATP-binding protein UgpC [Polyangia bacterium]|jgi:multiple sugar transport system ATP-binding protein|nr:sn-glycerol-3-phosphate ABC transporter ATP-binding protein UgpC [Polyangia bacterium]